MLEIKKKLLRLSKISPHLIYSADLARELSNSSDLTKAVLQAYFDAHPTDYLDELANFETLNGDYLPKQRKVFVSIPCFNEDRNLDHLVDLYAAQTGILGAPLSTDLFEVCFVVNYPEEGDSARTQSDIMRFEQSIEILLRRKPQHNNIHVLAKAFNPGLGSLGRARKYGIDYCLFRLMKQDPQLLDKVVIISNEGDTLDIPKNYVASYIDIFASGTPKFVQGIITYPRQLTETYEPIRLLTSCREAVHFGQGIFQEKFPFFNGIMPVGRNFGVSPRVYAQVGGIDPIRRKDTDDDMNFGTDIHFRLGERFKSIQPIPLVTNPRREVMIVRDILQGKKQDSKKSYEDFHENRALYDPSYQDILRIAEVQIPSTIPDRAMQCELVNQYFQWVLRSRYKENLNQVKGVSEILKRHFNHEISYWERESALCVSFEQHLQELEFSERQSIERKIIVEALNWFNYFVLGLNVAYDCTQESLKSRLV